MLPHQNVFVMAAAFICIVLVLTARHHPPSRRKIKEIWHGRVYWESNTTMLRSSVQVNDTRATFVHQSSNDMALEVESESKGDIEVSKTPLEITTQPPVASKKRDFLLFTSAGDKSNVKQWIGNSEEDRNYDIVVVYYGDKDMDYTVDESYIRKETKFPNLQWYMKNHPIDKYKAIAVWDDDIQASPTIINNLFAQMLLSYADVFSPCHTRGNFASLHKHNSEGWRYVEYIEMNAPIFLTWKINDFMSVFDPVIKGWGTELWYGHRCNKIHHSCTMAVSDSFCVTNPRTRTDGTREINKAQPEHIRSSTWAKYAQDVLKQPHGNPKSSQIKGYNHLKKISNRLSVPKITMLIIADKSSQKKYRKNIENMRCYAEKHGYGFLVESISTKCEKNTRGNFFYKKHCTVKEISEITKSQWLLVLDADNAVVNFDKKLEEYIDDSKQVIHGTRFHNNEISAGNYIIRNTDWGRQYLADWSSSLDNGFGGMNHDNGALHFLLLKRLSDISIPGHKECINKGKQSDDYMKFVSCVHEVLAKTKCQGFQWKHIKIIPNTIDSDWLAIDVGRSKAKWSTRSFMFHAMKMPYLSRYDVEIPSDCQSNQQSGHPITPEQYRKELVKTMLSYKNNPRGWDDNSCVQSTKITVTIGIPCIKEDMDKIQKLKKSIDAQTVQPDEVILVISDIPKDECPVIDNWKVFCREKLQHAGISRNDAWSEASSDVVTFIDADDEMYAERIEIIRDYFSRNPKLMLLIHEHSREPLSTHKQSTWPVRAKKDGHAIYMQMRKTQGKQLHLHGALHHGHISIRNNIKCEPYTNRRKGQDSEFVRKCVQTLGDSADKMLWLQVPLTRYLPRSVQEQVTKPVDSRNTGIWTKTANAREANLKRPLMSTDVELMSTDVDMDFVFFFGTRPEVIKMTPLYKQFSNAKTVFTGQHPDLVRPYLKKYGLGIDVQFTDVFKTGQTLVQLTSKLMLAADKLDITHKTVWVVQGDTTTTYAVAYVAFLNNIPVAHIEAGLRTYDMKAPFPEEFNRQSVSLISAANFAPTAKAAHALYSQGIPKSKVFVVGNTGIDSARIASGKLKTPHFLVDKLQNWNKTLIFMTMHRRENQRRMNQYYDTVAQVVGKRTDVKVLVPLHPNPLAKKAASNACEKYNTFICVKPLDYEATQWVLNRCSIVITDSGGLQEESTWYSKPVLVLRRSTERTEAIDVGVSLLAYDFDTLESNLSELLVPGSGLMEQMSQRTFAFGDGYAAEKIAKIMRTIDWYATDMKQIKPKLTEEQRKMDKNKDSMTRPFDSNVYWEERYKNGGNSGAGSYDKIAEYKGRVINNLCLKYTVDIVAEYGCGDGNNLRLYTNIKNYVGYDVSNTAILQRQKEYITDRTKTFIHYDGTRAPWNGSPLPIYDMTMSLDVLYHLVDINIWKTYLENLFTTSSKIVVIFATDIDRPASNHVLFRKFTQYIATHFKCWSLEPEPPKEVQKGTSARFYVYQHKEACSDGSSFGSRATNISQPKLTEYKPTIVPVLAIKSSESPKLEPKATDIVTSQPPCEEESQTVRECSSSNSKYQACSVKGTIDVILTVWKRGSLKSQLEDIAQQTKPVSHVWVVQNENHIEGVEHIVEDFKGTHPGIPTDIVKFGLNSKFHGRFYIAYFMSSAEYVSVWDDDIVVGNKWLEYSISESKKHGNALVGANGRIINSISPLKQIRNKGGENDFVGHTWTLRRELLRYFLATPQYTYLTGEDMQISFALQKHGIISWLPTHYNDGRYVRDTNWSGNNVASYIKPETSKQRSWLACTLIYNGFKTIDCNDCDKSTVVKCINARL